MSSNTVVGRLMRALGVRTLDELASKLPAPRSTVGSWSARGAIPLPALQRIAEQHRLSIGVLLTESSQDATPAPAGMKPEQNVGNDAFAVHQPLAVWRVRAGMKPEQNVGNDAFAPSSSTPVDPLGRASDGAAVLACNAPAGTGLGLPLVLRVAYPGGPLREYQVIPRFRTRARAGGASRPVAAAA